MPLPDLPDDERAELVRLVRDAIDGERYFLSPRMKRLKRLHVAHHNATTPPREATG